MSVFLKGFGTETITMDFLHLLRRIEPSAGDLATAASNGDRYSTCEIEAVTTIQRFWRSCYPKLRISRTFQDSPEAQAVAFFIALGAQKSATVATRAVLVSQGVHVYLRLATVQETLRDLQKQTITCVDNPRVPITWFESLDNIQERLRHIDGLLRDASQRMSKEHLAKQIEGGILTKLRRVFIDVEGVIERAEDEMRKGVEVVGSVSESPYVTTSSPY
jgi:hypothetical protein